MSYQRMERMPSLPGGGYWLAEPQAGLLEILYQSEPDPEPVLLFERTVFSAQSAQSPTLFRLSPQGGFMSWLAHAPQRLQGLLITTNRPLEDLLTHLRHLLQVRFLQRRRALLRYYDPRVASYLLPTLAGTHQSGWLGPIQQIAWFGGTWADEHAGQSCWHLLSNTEPAAAEPLPSPLALADEQLQRLVDQNHEHAAWRWLQGRSGHSMPQVLAWIKAGMAAGHTGQDALNTWLDSQSVAQGEQHG